MFGAANPQASLPCDVHLLNFKSLGMGTPSTALILHRRGTACGFRAPSADTPADAGAGGGGGVCAPSGATLDLARIFTRPATQIQVRTSLLKCLF